MNEPPKSVIIKVPNVNALSQLYQVTQRSGSDGENDPEIRAGFETILRTMHNDECNMYKMLDGEHVLPIARCHIALPSVPGADTGLLMLEDMSDRATGMGSFADWFNLDQSYEVVDALASLHAWSVRTSIPWRDRVATLTDRKEIYSTFFQLTPSLAPLVRDQLSEEFGPVSVERILSLVNLDSYLRILAPEITRRPNLPIVLVHGDVHCSNAMFERLPSGKPGGKLMALLDFQLVHVGYGTEDLARLMAMGTSSDIRRNHTDALLTRYVEVYNSKIDHSKDHIAFESVKEAYEEMYCIMSVWFSMTAAIADEFLKKSLEKLPDEEKKKIIRGFILNNAAMYRDAASVLGWQ